jgi:hypothetical protein
MTVSKSAIITDHIAAIERIRGCQPGRLKTITAGDRVRSAKDLCQQFIGGDHLGGIFVYQGIRRQ